MVRSGTERYEFGFAEGSPYGHALELLKRHGVSSGTVVDLGCGFGAVAEPLRDRGLGYLGADLEPSGIESLRGRGFDARLLDASDVTNVAQLLAGQDTAAVLMLDFLEHLPNPREFLAGLGTALVECGADNAIFVLSVPNVGHFDIAAKLLIGRWDTSETGLLDETHLSWFTSERLSSVLDEAGFRELGRNDFSLAVSDQGMEAELTVLGGTPLSALLRAVRERADEFGWVNQFVRAYEFAPLHSIESAEQPRDIAQHEPFLSVIMRTQGRRVQMLEEALLCLAAQAEQDLEVLVAVHTNDSPVVALVSEILESFPVEFSSRVRVLHVPSGNRGAPLNAGLAAATGKYVAFLDDDDLVMADWAAAFRERSTVAAGQVLRSVTMEQGIDPAPIGEYRVTGPLTFSYPERFDYLGHIHSNSTPICSMAIPRAFVNAATLVVSEDLRVLEDWDFLLQAANWCGVSDTCTPTAIYHRWSAGAASSAAEPQAVWDSARDAVLARLNAEVLLLPMGSASRVSTMVSDAQRSEGARRVEFELARLQGEVGEQFQEIARLHDIAIRRHPLVRKIKSALRRLR